MRLSFGIHGRLPGLNEIIAEAKKHPQAYAKMKRDYTDLVLYAIPGAVRRIQFGRSAIMIDWFERDGRRDPDNIMAGQKFILDALKKKRILPDDSQKYVQSIQHRFHVDAAQPRIVVEVYEVKEVIIEHPHGQGLREGGEEGGLPSPESG